MGLKNFSPLVFLASLGAGGIAIMPFVLMQYSIEHGKGLITRSQAWDSGLADFSVYLYSLEAIMIVFFLLHIFLTFIFFYQLVFWVRQGKHNQLIQDPLKNSAIVAPLISILMTMNVFIGPLRYFSGFMQGNFQAMFLPAMIFWSFMFFVVMYFEIRLLKISFEKGFDIDKISFGWLLHPFVLGMLTVVGTGIAAMSKNITLANTAAFMSLICGSMGLFLLIVKMFMIFKSHFSAESLPEKYFIPSFLIVIPNITLYAISAFRFGHYLEHAFGFNLGAYFVMVISISFAFEFWYFAFGIALMKDYFKKHHFSKEFYITQWGLICPIVAFGVLGSFFYNLFLGNVFIYGVIVFSIVIGVVFYLDLLYRHYNCAKGKFKINCEV